MKVMPDITRSKADFQKGTRTTGVSKQEGEMTGMTESNLSVTLDHLRQGGMVVLVDDEDRENEGDLLVAAEFATPDAIRFMAVHGRGLICLAMSGAQVDRLRLQPMVATNLARRSTAFTVSIEAREGITTGISCFDRSHTILTAINPRSAPGDIVSPGHVFPLRAKEGGVLARNGHTEGAVDLMEMAGLLLAGVICEVMGEDGHMARRPELEVFAHAHNLPILTIAEIVAFRKAEQDRKDQFLKASGRSG